MKKLLLVLTILSCLVFLLPSNISAQTSVVSGIATTFVSCATTSFTTASHQWAFYADSGNVLRYKVSTTLTGAAWGSEQTVDPTITSEYGWDVAFDGVRVHVTWCGYGASPHLYYKGGNVSDVGGNITWGTTYDLYGHSGYQLNPTIAVDTSGYKHIVWGDDCNPIHQYTMHAKSTTGNDTTFVAAFTSNSIDASCYPLATELHALTNNKLALVSRRYDLSGNPFGVNQYNGSIWSAKAVVPSTLSYTLNKGWSSVAQDDDVHITFLEETSSDILYTKYEGSDHHYHPNPETVLHAGAITTTAPAITRDTTENNLWVWYEHNPPGNDTVLLAVYDSSGTTWYVDIEYCTDSLGLTAALADNLSTQEAQERDMIGLYWTATGNVLRWKYLSDQFVVNTLPPSGVTLEQATLRGEIVSIAWGSVIERGFYLDTVASIGNATGTLIHWSDSSPPPYGVGIFSHTEGNLTIDQTYYYIAYASSGYETAWGNWTSFSTSEAPVPTPTGDTVTCGDTTAYNFLALPISNNEIKLTWDWYPASGNASVNIGIYYRLAHYPNSRADGTQIYYGSGDSFIHDNLLPGTTYYYCAWLYCDGNWTTDKICDWATTYGSAPGPSPPDEPEGWFLDPSCTAYEQIPLLSDALTAVNTGFGFPMPTICVVFTLIWISVLGLATYFFLRTAVLVTATIAVLIVITSIMGLLPLWMLLIAMALGGLTFYVWSRS